MEIKPLSRLFGLKWFPMVFQAAFLLVFLALIAIGLGANTADMRFATILRNTNLANLLVWSYWWPLVIISAVLLGRVWCTVCPMELLTTVASKVGLKRKAPGWMRNGWLITIFYILILIVGIHTLAIHRVPLRMALYMLFLMALSVVFGLVYEKRAFCNYLCPVGPLLGLYAFCSPLAVRVKNKQLCLACKSKDCIAHTNYYKLSGRSCTSDLYPPGLKHNRDCILCSQCFKSCPYDNVGLFSRRPLADIFAGVKITPSQAGLLFAISGFIVYEILSEWSVSKTILLWFPGTINNALNLSGTPLSSAVSAVVIFLLFPLAWWWSTLAGGRNSSIKASILQSAIYFIPIMAAAHLLKSLLKTTSRLPYIEQALQDPLGIETATAIQAGIFKLDKTVVDMLQNSISWFGLAAMLGGTVSAFAAISINRRKQGNPLSPMLYLGVGIYASIFLITLLYWRF